MKELFKILLAFFIAILCYQKGYNQSFNSRIEIYTIEDGLSQTGVNCLIQDSKGFLWIGTQDGLDRYDGNNFQIYRHQSADSNSICDNYIRFICEDHSGNLWIATNNGLSMYNRKIGRFRNYYSDPQEPNSLSDNSLYIVYEDSKGQIWVKTMQSIEKFDPKKEQFKHYFHYNNAFNYISGDYYFAILEDSNDRLWIGTKDGLNYFNRDLELFERFEYDPHNPYSISDNRIKSIFEDKDGILWVGTENGLNKFDYEAKKFFRYYSITGNPNSLIDNTINIIYQDHDGNIWIGSQNGLNLYNKNNNSFAQFNYVIYHNSKQPLTGVGSIIEDKSNILWIGSYQGLIKIDRKPFKFKLFREKESSLSAPENNISSILLENDNNLWIGTWGQGFKIMNRKTGSIKKFNTASPGIFLNDNSIYVLYYDNKSKIWIGTGSGIVQYDTQHKTFNPFCKNEPFCNIFQHNRVYTIYKDRSKNYWFATEHGLHLLEANTSQFKPYFEFPGDSSNIQHNTFYCITEDNEGTLWFGSNKGLISYNQQKEKIQHYTCNLKSVNTNISSNFIYSILCDNENTIWVGTSSGLNKFKRDSNNFVVYNEKDGLPNNLIYAIIEDNSSNLWLSTNRGLTRYNKKTGKFTNFDLADGLQSYEYNLGAAYKSNKGELFFGGISGFNAFFPDSLQFNHTIPNVVITSFELINKGSIKILNAESENEFRVPYFTNIFNIEFAVLDFTYVKNNQYQYQMSAKGIEGEWIHLGNRHNATFSNLSPGKYTFKVRGANSDQVWSKEDVSITIIVEGPFWKTRTSITIYFIIFLMSLYGIMQWRTSSLRKTNKVLKEKELASLQIGKQKEELSIKNKNITDSINYAKRIQMSMMPSEKTLKRLLPNSFVYHKPKDIVSGDFYWLQERSEKVFVAAVDCTGHGVPGAFMSILGFELFRKIIQNECADPGKILYQVNEDFSKIFHDMDEMTLRDGMDIAFCVIDKANYILEFSGAINPIYIIRDNKIIEVKGNRYSVSMEKNPEILEFKTHQIHLQKEDMIYMFSDGYADQFGGYEGKKFKYRRFRHLLLNIHKLPLNDQKTYLDESMEMWRGNFDQVDDILIIGIKAEF